MPNVTEILNKYFPDADPSVIMEHLGVSNYEELVQHFGDQQFVQDFVSELGQYGVSPEAVSGFFSGENINIGDLQLGDLGNIANKDDLLGKAGDFISGLLG
jgi:hypothetical protein